MNTPPVKHHTTLKVKFSDVPDDGVHAAPEKILEVSFGELESASDCLLIGYPTLLDWGPHFFRDIDGNPWVDFIKLYVAMPTEVPNQG
jgi:hypothetical protein